MEGALPIAELAVQLPASTAAQKGAPDCPICFGFLCEPLTIACGHSFCRACLLESTRLSPTGRSCPLCRSQVDIKNPMTHPVDKDLERDVLAVVPLEDYHVRQKCSKDRLDELQHKADTQLPIFFMYPGTIVDAPVALHFFEPRYKILIRRAWEGSRLFIFCPCSPRRGDQGVLVRVSQAQFLADGRANIRGHGEQAVTLGNVWVEEGTGGLFYTKLDAPNANGHSEEFHLEADAPAQRVVGSRCLCAVM